MDKNINSVGSCFKWATFRYLTLLSIFVLSGFSPAAICADTADSVNSADSDEADLQALQQTQQMLRDAKLREEAVARDPKARAAHEHASQVAGSEKNLNAMYDLSAEVMDTVTKEAGNDPVKMQKLMKEASENPEGFAKRFTPSQKAKLKAISEQIPDRQKK